MPDTNLAAESSREMDRPHALLPWTSFGPCEDQGALMIRRGEGCSLGEANGETCIDVVGGLRSTNLGLGRREMVQDLVAPLQDDRDLDTRISDARGAMDPMVRPIAHQNGMSPRQILSEDDGDFVLRTSDKAFRLGTDRFVKEGVRIG